MSETPVPFAIPVQQKPPYPPELDTFDEDIAVTLIQNLVEAARGVALCLGSLSGDIRDVENILGGLASILKIAVDRVEAEYFRTPGDLATTIDPELLSGLLARQIDRLTKNQRRQIGRTESE